MDIAPEDGKSDSLQTVEMFLEYLATEEVDALSAVVIVAEVIGPDGTANMAWFRDDLSREWKHDGMLKYARIAIEHDFIEAYDPIPVGDEGDDDAA